MRRARWRRRPSPTEPNPTPEIPPLNPPMATYPSQGDARRKDAVARSRRRAIRAADRAQKDRWPSGLRHTLGKRAWCNSHRGFESRPVRHFRVDSPLLRAFLSLSVFLPTNVPTKMAKTTSSGPPPRWIKPQLTRLVDEAPAGNEWLHDIKYDGYRMHARLDGSQVKLLAWTGRVATSAPLRPWGRSRSSRPISMASYALSMLTACRPSVACRP